MEPSTLIKVFDIAKKLEDKSTDIEDINKALTYRLTLKIAKACDSTDEFVKAILQHQYPPIALTQIEAEFLKSGGLPDGLNQNPFIFD